ncbi:MAG: MFS transporter [Myxococcales bacterium]|nr:MFS transporter [Myxococcales bacterium]
MQSAIGGLPAPFWYLWLGTLVNRLGGFVLPFLMVYLTEVQMLSVEVAGAVISSYGLGSILSSPLGGFLCDRVGRKATLLASLCLGAGAMVCLGLARNPEEIVLATVGLGLVTDMFRPAANAMLSDVVPPEHRLRAFGLLYWAINLGAAVAPVIAGTLARRGYFLLFLADAATTLVCAGLIALRIPETRPRTDGAGEPAKVSGLLVPFRDGVFRAFFLLTLVVAVVFFQFIASLPADLRAHGVSEQQYGLVIGLNGVLIILIQPFATAWMGRIRRSSALAAAALLVGLGFGLNGLVSTAPWYATAVAVWTFGEILLAPVNASVVADLAPAHMRGRYQGAFALAWSFAHLLAPLLGALVLGRLGGSWLWGGCAVAGALAAVGHLAIGPARRRRMAELGSRD